MAGPEPHSNAGTSLQVASFTIEDDGRMPNSRLPVLLYQRAVALPSADPAAAMEQAFQANGWEGAWRNGIYDYHHYHSTAHEVLGVFGGSATVQLGGERGVTQRVEPGDVLIIPAGVAHKNLGSTDDFGVVGAYPAGQSWDMCYGKPEERPQADQHIARVPLPKADPVFGADGPLLKLWVS